MEKLRKISKELRLKVLEDIHRSKMGHIGGTYSALDLFVYLYYGDYGLRQYAEQDVLFEDRDRLVIDKGHACLALYNIWVELGLLAQWDLDKFGDNGAFLSGQLNINTPGVEYNTGSLGHAIGIASGMAMAGRINNKDYYSIALIGDGECSEGSVWEAIEFAGQQQLDKLFCIVDFNRLGVTDFVGVEEEDLRRRVESYGWHCNIIDGHNFLSIESAFKMLQDIEKPYMAIARTTKGKGISFMENGVKWHHSVPSEEEYLIAKKELEA